MKGERILAVDLSNQVYKAVHGFRALSSGDVFTGGLYGFLRMVSRAMLVTGANRVVVCADRKPYKRALVYPEYKQIRAKSSDPEIAADAKLSQGMVVQALQALRIPLWEAAGYEADDLAGVLVRKHHHRFDQIISMSGDADLFQLLDVENYSIFAGAAVGARRAGKSAPPDVIHTPQSFAASHGGMTSAQYVEYLALQGTHNDVAGIHGIGPAKAKAAVLGGGALGVARELYLANRGLIDRNKALIELPMPGFPAEQYPLPERTDVDIRALVRFCDQYDIDVTSDMELAFTQCNRRSSR